MAMLWLTKYTSRTFVEGRMAGERWKSNESRFQGCRSSFVDKFIQHSPLEYKSRVSLVIGWFVAAVNMSLIDCA